MDPCWAHRSHGPIDWDGRDEWGCAGQAHNRIGGAGWNSRVGNPGNSFNINENAEITKEIDGITKVQLVAEVPKQSYSINGLEIENTKLLTFSGALAYILQSKSTTANFEKEENKLITNFQQQRFFSQFFKFGLGFILLLLLVNFFYFNSYFVPFFSYVY